MGVGFSLFTKRYQGDDQTRALLIAQFSAIAIAISLFYAVVHPYVNIHVPRWVFFALPAGLFVNLFLLARKQWAVRYIAQHSIFVFWASFAVGIAFSGGIHSLVLPWLALMPIMAHFLVSQQAAKVWLVVSLSSIVFFNFYFDNSQIVVDAGASWRSTFSLIGLVCITFFFTHLFYKANTSMLEQVKGQNFQLLEQREEIQTQNEELVQQKTEIISQATFIQRQNDLLAQQNRQIEAMNEQLRQRVREITERNALLEKHWHMLLEISKSRAINFGDFDEGMKYLTQMAAVNLQTSRVSVWAYRPEQEEIECLALYNAETSRHEQEQSLSMVDFPKYFAAIKKEQAVIADDAKFHPYTAEFKDAYLAPHNICSMMDAPFFIDGKLGGVLCCEHAGALRHWTPEDVLFAQALADIVTLAYRANQRRDYERRIRQHRKDIVKLNQSLEERVRVRTKELEQQNQQLAEYAYINSHLLRAPLSRLLGLINLFDYSRSTSDKEAELIDHLRKSGAELDEVVRKINEAIVDGGNLSREAFKHNDRQQNL